MQLNFLSVFSLAVSVPDATITGQHPAARFDMPLYVQKAAQQ